MPNVRKHPRLVDGGATALQRLQLNLAGQKRTLLEHLATVLAGAHELARRTGDSALHATTRQLADMIAAIASPDPERPDALKHDLETIENLLRTISAQANAHHVDNRPNQEAHRI